MRQAWGLACRCLVPPDGIATCDGHELEIHRRDASGVTNLLLSGEFEPEETRCIERAIEAGMIVADVGANIGIHTLTMARAVGPRGVVYAFEPEPGNLELLRRNVRRNGYADRVRVVAAAVSDVAGPARLRLHPDSMSEHRLDDGPDATGTIDVEAVTLDGFLDAEGVSPDLVKIDVEGAENRVLRGAAKILASGRAMTIVAEQWPPGTRLAPADAADFPAILRDAGFEETVISEFRSGRKNVAWTRA